MVIAYRGSYVRLSIESLSIVDQDVSSGGEVDCFLVVIGGNFVSCYWYISIVIINLVIMPTFLYGPLSDSLTV